MSGQNRVKISALCTYLEAEPPVEANTQQDVVDRHDRLYLLIIFRGILFPNSSSVFVSLRYLVFLEHLDRLGDYSWGGAVLAYLYRYLCRASIGAVSDVCGFFALLQLFIWTPYAVILDGLPAFCRPGQGVWRSRCPLIHLDIVEDHMPEHVLRQFGHTQSIPPDVRHEFRHYQRDDRAAVDDAFRAFMGVQLHRWQHRLALLAVVGHLTPIQDYMRWYHRITRRLIDNPALRSARDVGYSTLVGDEALATGGRTMITHIGVRAYVLPRACGACNGDGTDI
ncbi:protein MAIN-LIKE 1-like [Lycium ferocissimum]|uniref:protein MAIN-LIKE 1-like n=1 Tax=Lycium ferocissimum TaxID=112874 RepID=UPI002814974A|nr:protein MAIN-LIKE 1-like [Lycium ferocissimum]